MAFESINTTTIEAGKPVTGSLMTTIKDNFDYLYTAFVGLAGTGNVDLINERVEITPLDYSGIVFDTVLTSAEITKWFGATWDSGDTAITATKFGGGTVAHNNAAGYFAMQMTSALGTQHAQQTKLPTSAFTGTGSATVAGTVDGGSHTHSYTTSATQGGHIHLIQKTGGSGGSSPILTVDSYGDGSWASASTTLRTYQDIMTSVNAGVHQHSGNTDAYSPSYNWSQSSGSASITVNGGGDTYTRPLAVGVNKAVKKTCEILTKKWIVKRVNTNLIISSATLTVLGAGTAGTCSIDIKKGASLGSLTSIYSTKPSVGYASGSNYTSTNQVLSSPATLAAGDWVVLYIENLQEGQTEFHINLNCQTA